MVALQIERMRSRPSLKLKQCLALVVVVTLGLVAVGCAGELPEEGKQDTIYYPPSDQYVWPDTSPSQSDSLWPSTDGYSGSPLGCRSDSDCFGLRCCDTPWGVKLCAASCL